MSTQMRTSAGLWGALRRAQRAPSVHNTQPWRWRLTDVGVELHADRTRHLVDTDPDQRDLIISCGAALHHLRVALAAAGLAASVDRLPNPDNSDHLATIRPRPGSPEPADAELARGIELRHTDRRRFTAQSVPASVLADLTATATANGAVLHPVTDDASRRQLIAVLVEAASQQRHIPGYSAELTIWTRRYSDARDGVPAESRPTAGAQPLGLGLRPFPPGRLTSPAYPSEPDQDGSTLLVLTTAEDGMLDQLRAGEATSAVLLAATHHRLATTPLSHALEVAHTRRQLASRVLRLPDAVPQLVIRIGWATSGLELVPTPRRPLESVVLRR
ncbi:Acg family FMN-binding oxidoreductase [Pseudonocardia yunnanensis]|uniref:Acg family FMN-binding oxidoreductase n=1 Tax=Pseudonocardia yunnanensis TaxID=58107 RepID=A0ABW4EP71_9PSEU